MIACYKCANKAVWCYMPGKGGADDYYCASHVNRGCSCNEYGGKKYFDSNGMDLPCCEYGYDEKGFDYEDAEETEAYEDCD